MAELRLVNAGNSLRANSIALHRELALNRIEP